MSAIDSESTTTTTENRVKRLRRALAREGMRLHRRGDGYMVSDLETRALIDGGTPVPYFLDLETAEEYATAG